MSRTSHTGGPRNQLMETVRQDRVNANSDSKEDREEEIIIEEPAAKEVDENYK